MQNLLENLGVRHQWLAVGDGALEQLPGDGLVGMISTDEVHGLASVQANGGGQKSGGANQLVLQNPTRRPP